VSSKLSATASIGAACQAAHAQQQQPSSNVSNSSFVLYYAAAHAKAVLQAASVVLKSQ
jgi:hypothetical protein